MRATEAAERTARRAGWAAMALGALLWVASPAFMDIGYDGNAYVATGHGWMRTGELVLAWGDVLTFHPTGEQPSHHFPPAYPVYLGLFFTAFGYGLAQAKAAAVVASLAMLAVVYATTRDLYGRTAAAVTGGLVALTPQLLWATGMGFSEPLSLALFALTMWAIVRSLDDERFIVLAGLFAGVAYLARASMGAFFVIAGLGGLAWRLHHRGFRRTFASGWYGLAIVLFGLVVGAWAWRNVHLFGWPNWETSAGSRGIPRWIAEHPREFALGLLVRTPLMLAVAAPFVALLWPEARRSLRRIRDEHTSALWLSVGLVWVLGILFSAAYFSMGPTRHEALRLDTMRYVVVGLLPLAWALVREADWRERATRARFGALGILLVLGCAAVFAFPAQYPLAQAARSLDPFLQEGDTVVIDGAGKYPFYAYVSEPLGLTVYNIQHADWRNDPPEFLVTTKGQRPDGYVVLLEDVQRYPLWPAADDPVAVLGRADVVEARDVKLAPLRTGW